MGDILSSRMSNIMHSSGEENIPACMQIYANSYVVVSGVLG